MTWLKNIFRRTKAISARDILISSGWQCATCDQFHEGMFDIGAVAPDYWSLPYEAEPNSALRMSGDFLSDDFCVLDGKDFFVRCVFEIPVLTISKRFGFGVWSTLSRTNFESYVEYFDESIEPLAEPWTGYFSNNLRGFPDTVPQPCWVAPRAERQRPTLTLMDENHDLSIAQTGGVTPERILEIYASYGHEIL